MAALNRLRIFNRFMHLSLTSLDGVPLEMIDLVLEYAAHTE